MTRFLNATVAATTALIPFVLASSCADDIPSTPIDDDTTIEEPGGAPVDGIGTVLDPADPFVEPPPPGTLGVRFARYDGAFDALPDFSTRAPSEVGIVDNFELGSSVDSDRYAFAFEAELDVDVGGAHTLFITSDDGSRVTVDGTVVVSNDGLHGAAEQQGTVELGVGRHPMRVEFFENVGDAVLLVEWQPPAGVRGTIPDERLLLGPNTFPAPVVVDPGVFHFEDSLRGGSAGIVLGGAFDGDGWRVTADTDRIVFDQVPRLGSGSIEFTLTGASEANLLHGDNEIFAMYEGGYDVVEPIGYSPELRNNHYKSMLRIYGIEETGRERAQKLMWGMCPDGAPGYNTDGPCACARQFFEEPFNDEDAVRVWTGAPERIRIEWGDGLTRYSRNGATIIEIDWSDAGLPFAPNELHFSLGTPRPTAVGSAGMPVGAVFSDVVIDGVVTDDVARCE